MPVPHWFGFLTTLLADKLVSSIVIAVAMAAATTAWAQTTSPGTAPASEEPRYARATAVPEEMIRHRPRQIIALPSEPGEAGEDPLQLSSGVLGKLPPDVHRLPEGHVVAGVQVGIERQDDWLVCYLPQERLADASLKQAEGWAGDLDAGRLPHGLAKACQDKGVTLAPEATVVAEEPHRRWRIIDPRRAILVELDRQGAVLRALLPLRVLPNKRLMVLEAILSAGDKRDFAITGRITEFQGTNYVLLEHIAEVVAMKPIGGEANTGSGQRGTNESSGAAGAAASGPAGRDPRPEDIIRRLLDSNPRRAVVLPGTMPAGVAASPAGPVAEGDARADPQLWPEETILVDRPGRVVPGDKWWTFSFEDRSASAARKPIRLLPNRMLENAIASGGDTTLGVVLIVSGEVTEYRGANYLLLRKVLVQRDWGNFR
ncbi:MAG: hypothetical protein HY718_20915 [Planctomycetes bacterium]|nr:hypothetical protein [Planctomycetota bacterium]